MFRNFTSARGMSSPLIGFFLFFLNILLLFFQINKYVEINKDKNTCMAKRRKGTRLVRSDHQPNKKKRRERERAERSRIPRLSSTQLELWDCGAGELLFYTQTFL
jgi:hypothetical protein